MAKSLHLALLFIDSELLRKQIICTVMLKLLNGLLCLGKDNHVMIFLKGKLKCKSPLAKQSIWKLKT